MLRGSFRYLSANARIRAKEAKLLPREWFDQLAGFDSLDEIISLLTGTEYGPYLEGETGRSFFHIEACLLSRRLALEKELLPLLPSEARDLLISLSRRWDVRNLKTLARGKLQGMTPESLAEYLVPGGLLKEAAWNTLLEQNNLEEIRLSLSGTEYGIELEFLSLTDGIAALPEFETALDRAYWRLLFCAVRGPYLRMIFPQIQAQIQARDLLLLLQARLDGISIGQAQEWLISPDSLDPGVFRAYEAELTPGTISEMLSRTVFSALDKEMDMKSDQKTAFLSTLETTMGRTLHGLVRDLSLGHPYGFPPVWAYLWTQESESRNILKIAKAKEAGLGKEDTMNLLEGVA